MQRNSFCPSRAISADVWPGDQGRSWNASARNRLGAEGAGGCPAGHDLHIGRVVRKVEQVRRRGLLAELPGDDPRVIGSQPKRDQGADVSEDRWPHRFVELGEVLVREDEVHSVLSKFGEHVREALRRKGLELVEVDVEVAPQWFFGIGPPKTLQADSCHEKRTEKGCRPLADATLRKVHEEDLAVIHDTSEVERTLLGGQNLPKIRVREKGSDFVLDRRDDARAESPGVVLVFPSP